MVFKQKQHITDVHAEMILLTEQKDQNRNDVDGERNFNSPPPMPNERYPNYVELAWVQAAHKYSICFELVCHCLELCGLRKETVRYNYFIYYVRNMNNIKISE